MKSVGPILSKAQLHSHPLSCCFPCFLAQQLSIMPAYNSARGTGTNEIKHQATPRNKLHAIPIYVNMQACYDQQALLQPQFCHETGKVDLSWHMGVGLPGWSTPNSLPSPHSLHNTGCQSRPQGSNKHTPCSSCLLPPSCPSLLLHMLQHTIKP